MQRLMGGKENQLLGEIATGMILQQAAEHKVREQISSYQEDDPEDQEAVDQWRQQRLAEIRSQQSKIQEDIVCRSHGEYREITQDEFLPAVTRSNHVVCHFYHRDFQRCRIIDHHLRIIAQTHPETRFIKLDSEKAPFFVDRLNIRTLPTVVLFRDGVAFDRIIGYEGVSDKDDFPTLALTRRLVKSNIIKPKNKAERGMQLKFGSDSESSGSDLE